VDHQQIIAATNPAVPAARLSDVSEAVLGFVRDG
jgi:hypothetical protein